MERGVTDTFSSSCFFVVVQLVISEPVRREPPVACNFLIKTPKHLFIAVKEALHLPTPSPAERKQRRSLL